MRSPRDVAGQGEALAGAGALHEGDVRPRLREVPQAGQFPRVEDVSARLGRRRKRTEGGHPAGPGSTGCGPPSRPEGGEGAGHQAVAGGQAVLSVGGRELAQAARRPLGSAGRGEDRQPELGQVGDATELLLHEAHVVDGALAPGAEAGQRPQRRGQAEPPGAASRARRDQSPAWYQACACSPTAPAARRRPAGASPGRSPWGRRRARRPAPRPGGARRPAGRRRGPSRPGPGGGRVAPGAPARGRSPGQRGRPGAGRSPARAVGGHVGVGKVRSGRYGGAEDEAHAATRSSGGARRVEARDLVRVEPAQGAGRPRAELLLQVPAHGHAPRAGEEPAGVGGRGQLQGERLGEESVARKFSAGPMAAAFVRGVTIWTGPCPCDALALGAGGGEVVRVTLALVSGRGRRSKPAAALRAPPAGGERRPTARPLPQVVEVAALRQGEGDEAVPQQGPEAAGCSPARRDRRRARRRRCGRGRGTPGGRPGTRCPGAEGGRRQPTAVR